MSLFPERSPTMAILLAIFISIVITVTPAMAAPPDVMTIMNQMKELFEPLRPSTSKLVITTEHKGERAQFTAVQARKKFPDGKRMLTVMLEPDATRGFALLAWEPDKKPTVLWVYMPALRRVLELRTVETYEGFFGTEFTYADLGFIALHERYRLVGEEELTGRHAYKVEEQAPQEQSYYSRIITWIATDSMLPLQRDYFDRAGRLWKTELFEASVIDGAPTPVRILMKDIQRQSSTELNVISVDNNVEIPDDVFKPELLREVVNCPLWLKYCPIPPKKK
jgi:outer membrane lipoprotein-sorting protein